MMTKAQLSRELALRVGLAARVLPDTDPARLLGVLEDAIGLPVRADKLASLSAKDLKNASDREFGDVLPAQIKEAVAILKGEVAFEGGSAGAPQVEAFQDGDMPGSIRVAVASNTGEALDGHFGSCARFLVYQVASDEVRLIDVRAGAQAPKDEDKNAARVSLISDCHVLYVMSIGGPAAAKVVGRGLHPIKQPQGGNARDAATRMCGVLAGKPPPWLAKVMGHAPEERIRFSRSESEAMSSGEEA